MMATLKNWIVSKLGSWPDVEPVQMAVACLLWSVLRPFLKEE
jgi:hypothetical protein